MENFSTSQKHVIVPGFVIFLVIRCRSTFPYPSYPILFMRSRHSQYSSPGGCWPIYRMKLWRLVSLINDGVIKWKRFLRYWPFVRGIDRSPVNSPHKGQRRGALMLSFICAWINGWVNNGEAGDLRRHRAQYDVRVMSSSNAHQASMPQGDGSDYFKSLAKFALSNTHRVPDRCDVHSPKTV